MSQDDRPARDPRVNDADFTDAAPGRLIRTLEGVNAFVPNPLPPAVESSWPLIKGHGDARAAVGKLDPKDPRYGDAAFNAGDLYTLAGNTREALTYYRLASEHGTGEIKARAKVAVELTQ